MCGIVGIVGTHAVAPALYDALTMLQHRGQDAAGIATLDGYRVNLHKGSGLVRDCFSRSDMLKLTGNIGIGHARYPTAGMDDSSEAQPFYVNSPYGIALGHNGNLINTESLTQELFDSDRRHLNTQSDSEVLLNVLAHEIQAQNPGALLPLATPKAQAEYTFWYSGIGSGVSPGISLTIWVSCRTILSRIPT